KPEEDWGHK
uniref:Skin secreted peptide P1-1 n=1 Tax=Phasmahyla jandaia TaxID=762504 RepID=SSP11_PHAJA|nr:RecName: Full=Skin secreted peptide P1-1; Short=PjP1-1 [Phasmahyla jandaia]